MVECDKLAGAESADYCMALVRERDIDRYLATLFLPENVRPHVYALYAFDAEISHIRNMIKEPMMGEIRLQWWRDIISGERAGEAANNPVASALLHAIATHDLPKMGFDNFLKAKTFDLYNDPMPDMGTLEGYAGETASFLFYQVAVMLGKAHGFKPDGLADCAGHAGVAWTMLEILKNLPNQRARHQCYIPAEMLVKAGLTLDEYLSTDGEVHTGALVEALYSKLQYHHQEFSNNVTGLAGEIKSAFLPLCLLPAYIARFKKQAVTALITPVDIPQWRKQIHIWRCARNGKF